MGIHEESDVVIGVPFVFQTNKLYVCPQLRLFVLESDGALTREWVDRVTGGAWDVAQVERERERVGGEGGGGRVGHGCICMGTYGLACVYGDVCVCVGLGWA